MHKDLTVYDDTINFYKQLMGRPQGEDVPEFSIGQLSALHVRNYIYSLLHQFFPQP